MCSITLSFRLNQTTFCIHKIKLTLEGLTTLKIGELLLTANSPNLSGLTIWRVTVNG